MEIKIKVKGKDHVMLPVNNKRYKLLQEAIRQTEGMAILGENVFTDEALEIIEETAVILFGNKFTKEEVEETALTVDLIFMFQEIQIAMDKELADKMEALGKRFFPPKEEDSPLET